MWSFEVSRKGCRWLIRSDDLFERLAPLFDGFGCFERNFGLIIQENTSYMIPNSIYTVQIPTEVK